MNDSSVVEVFLRFYDFLKNGRFFSTVVFEMFPFINSHNSYSRLDGCIDGRIVLGQINCNCIQ